MTQYSTTERKAFLQEWKESGKSVEEYCREKNIRSTTFYGWTKRQKNNNQTENQFVEVKPKQVKVKSSAMIIKKSDLKIHILSGAVTSDLKQLLKLLGIIP